MKTHFGIDRTGTGALLLLPLLSLEILPKRYADHRIRLAFNWLNMYGSVVLIPTRVRQKVKEILANIVIALPAFFILLHKLYVTFAGR